MQKPTGKLGKKGGAKRVAEMASKIRKAPISKSVFEILDKYNEKTKDKSDKKSAKPISDLEV